MEDACRIKLEGQVIVPNNGAFTIQLIVED